MGLWKLAAFLLGALVTLAPAGSASAQGVVVAGMTSQLLTARGIQVTTRTGFSTAGVRTEQEAGLVDIYWEYTGTSLLTFNGVRESLGPKEAYDRVAELDGR